ncbi:MAG: L-2-hydroxyglutarate oxidase [Fuerstiella sp.]|nr:L-2-hydroxyglutarate oxidase [Fuerstiella sp.]
MSQTDVVVVGGGIIGLATAWQLVERSPKTRVVLLEKEDRLASHQTGRNSGVIHSGIYYKPGSLRARNCRDGKKALELFCSEYGVAWEKTGKVIVATQDDQLPALERIYQRGQKNGVSCEIVDKDRLSELEPHAAGVRAIHVPESGIVDYPGMCERLGDLLTERGVDIRLSVRVTEIRQSADAVEVVCGDQTIRATQVVNCAGLYSDRVAKMSGQKMNEQIVPFRGEFFTLKPDATHLCRGLIYPVPDPRFPFLGVHFTKIVTGGVECGPNAVLALAREGYRWSHINLRDLTESLMFPGFLRLAMKYWKTGAGEVWRSFSRRAFVRALQNLVPEIRAGHLIAAPSGVRAQALAPTGDLVDDFLILRTNRTLNVCNAPSPAATASLTIARQIVDRLEL